MAMPSSSSKSIAVLGGSYAAISTAHYTLRHVIPSLPDRGSYRLVLVSASSHSMCRPAAPRAMISDDFLDMNKVFVDIEQSFKQYQAPTAFQFIHGSATELDHQARQVTINTGSGTVTLDFHALVIATGSSTPSPLLGLNGDVKDLRAAWAQLRSSLLKIKTIVIGGGGPAGVEVAGELGAYLNGRAGRGHDKQQVEITIVTAGAQILPLLRPKIALQAERQLQQLGVSIMKSVSIQGTEPKNAGTLGGLTSKATVHLSNGTPIDTDLYIPTTGTIPNTDFVDPALLASTQRVDTNPQTLRVDKAGPRIYALGDCSAAFRPAVHLILDAVPVLCANLKRDLLLAAGEQEHDVGKDWRYKEDVRETQLVVIGTKKGVGAAMGWQLPSWLVWLIKGRDYWLWTTTGLWSGKQWEKEK